MSTTTRSRLQELGLDDLRAMAGKVEVEPEGLQKSKLIAAILDSSGFDAAMLPETSAEPKPAVTVERDGDGSKPELDGGGEQRQQPSQRSQQGQQGQQGDNRDNRDNKDSAVEGDVAVVPRSRSTNPSSKYGRGSSTSSQRGMASCAAAVISQATKTYMWPRT